MMLRSPTGESTMRTPSPALAFLLLCTAVARSQQAAAEAVPPQPADRLVPSYATITIAAPPEPLGLDPFYRKHVDALGIPIATSEKVPDDALLVARDIVNAMLVGRPDVRKAMVARGYRVSIMAASEMQTDLPEHRDMKKPTLDDPRLTPGERARYDQPGGIGGMTDREYWNARARGMGGRVTSCAEENLLGYPGTRYFGEHIFVHEFSHAIMSALRVADPQLLSRIQSAYRAAKAAGRFRGHYAENTVAEYWAEGTQWWFWSNYEWFDGETRVWSPDDLAAYDPELFALLGEVYVGHHIAADVYHGRDVRPARRPR